MRILKKKAITIAEVNELLKQIAPEQLNPIQKRVLDYTSKFSKLPGERAKELIIKLKSEVGLAEEEAVEIVNILPETLDELRGIVSGWKKLLSTEALQRILAIITKETRADNRQD